MTGVISLRGFLFTGDFRLGIEARIIGSYGSMKAYFFWQGPGRVSNVNGESYVFNVVTPTVDAANPSGRFGERMCGFEALGGLVNQICGFGSAWRHLYSENPREFSDFILKRFFDESKSRQEEIVPLIHSPETNYNELLKYIQSSLPILDVSRAG